MQNKCDLKKLGIFLSAKSWQDFLGIIFSAETFIDFHIWAKHYSTTA